MNVTNDLRIRRYILAGIMLAVSLGMIFTGTGGSISVSIPLSFTFIVQIGGSNLYQAFITGGSGLPFYTESNFTKLIHDDIESGSSCANGCSLSMNPGKYNLTQTIVVDKPKFSVAGSTSSVIQPQNVTNWNTTFNKAAFALTSTNTVLEGFTIDDAKRVGTLNTGDSILGQPTSSNVLLRSLMVQNATSDAVNIQGSNYIVTTSTLQGPVPPAFTTNYGILMGATASGVRIFLNSISRFNYSDTAAISSSVGASFVSITSNNIFANSIGILSNWGKFLTIEANNIHDNYAAGIVLTTQIVSSANAGPVNINDNLITDNGKEPNTDAICNNQHCSGIVIRGTRPAWDSVTIVSNSIKDTQTVHTQYAGIYIFSTQYTNLTITGNTLGKSLSGKAIIMTVNALGSWIIAENAGFNPQPVRGPLTAGATPFTYTNFDGYKEQIELITIGDMTAFTCRGIANIIQVDAISPILNTLDTCVFTYVAVAPTYDVLPT